MRGRCAVPALTLAAFTLAAALFAAAVLAACGDTAATSDAGARDDGTPPTDAGAADAADGAASLDADARRDAGDRDARVELEMPWFVEVARMEGRGRVDLWVGNDYGSVYADRPLRWDAARRRFADVSDVIGLARNQRGYGTDTMGWTTGDVDGDGNVDHVTSSFALDATAVYLCADGFCEDRARTIGTTVTDHTFRWGVALADFDLDGDLDLIEATCQIYLEAEIAPLRTVGPSDQTPNLYENRDGALALRSGAEGAAFTRPG